MSYIETKQWKNGDATTPVKYYRCDVTGKQIVECDPHFKYGDIHISEDGAEKIIEDYVQHWGSYYSVGYPIFLKWLINRFTKKIRRNEYISKKLRKSVLLIYKHKCNFCGATDKLEIDHIKPVSLGGLTELKNLQVLCKPCNIIKSNKF